METKQAKEDKAVIDIVKEMQKTVSALGREIGELKEKIDALPADCVKSDEIERLIKAVAKIPESLTETVGGLKRSFREARAGIDESIAGLRPGRPLLNVTVSNRFLMGLTVAVLLAVSIGTLAVINSPMCLAHRLYAQCTYGDVRNPGWYYHDAYTKVRAGKRKEVRAQIRSRELQRKSYREAEAVLAPLVGADIYVTKIQYGRNLDLLVDYRHRGNDVYWSAYIPADGSIWITDSDKIVVPLDAEKTLTSKKVKWEKIDNLAATNQNRTQNEKRHL